MKIMRIRAGMIMAGIIISNIAFGQDTAHTRLVDKYFPKAATPAAAPQNKAPENIITPLSRNEPVSNSAVQQRPVNNTKPISGAIAAQPTQIPGTKPDESDLNIASPVTTTPATDVSSQQQKPIVNNDRIASPSMQAPAISNRATAVSTENHVYRDTRLGSSSPLYDTYKKNDNGAGAVTTNPNKSMGSNYTANEETSTPAASNPVYNPNRLGSSSPQYDTYKTNNNGAGSVTTSPK